VIEIRRQSKFNINQTKKGKQNRTYNNIIFDSLLEMQYYRDVVCAGLRNGTIKDCQLQVKYELQPKFKYKGENVQAINYVADFVVTYSDGSVKVIDTKGLPDATAKLKKKLFHYKYPNINYVWMAYSKIDGGWMEYKDIEKARKQRKKEKKNIK